MPDRILAQLGMTVELTDILAALRTRWWLPLTGLLIGACAALAYTILATPMYASTSQFFVSTTGSTTTSDVLQGSELSRQRAASYAELLKGTLVPSRVVQRLDLNLTPRDLSERISVEAVPETVLIDVSVEDPSPRRAQQIATVLGEEFIQRVRELEPVGVGDSPSVRVTVAEPASLPTNPATPGGALVLALGLLTGMGAGGALALVRARLDTSVKDSHEAGLLAGAPTLGLIRRDPSVSEGKTIDHERNGPAAEDYRRLRANLQYLRVDEPPRVIMVTSPMPSEGKTTAVLNLAVALADAGRRVTVVDADLRRPRIASYLGLVEGVGLTTVLGGAAGVDDVIQRYGDDDLWVVATGPRPANPGELLASTTMSTFIEKLRAQNDYVIVDAPPLLPVADSSGLAVHMDGVLVVVRYGRTRKRQLHQAVKALSQVGATTLGVILNLLPPRAEEAGGGYRYD